MTEHERHQEVAQILAHGIIRLCAQATEEIAQKSQIQLAMPATKSNGMDSSTPKGLLS